MSVAAALRAQAAVLLALADQIERGEPAEPRPELPAMVGPADVGVTRSEWKSAIASGQLKASRVGKRLLATREDFAAYLASRRVEPGVRTRAPVESPDEVTELVNQAVRSGQLRAVAGGRRR